MILDIHVAIFQFSELNRINLFIFFFQNQINQKSLDRKL